MYLSLIHICSVKQAGGFIIQLMPFTPDEVVDALEKKISEIASVTEMLEEGNTPEPVSYTHLDSRFGIGRWKKLSDWQMWQNATEVFV